MSEESPLILLVDDDVDFLAINRHLLEHAGYRTVCCTDPEEAWQKLNTERPGLVISDLMMSNLDAGFSLARRIKEHPDLRGVPVIIATAAGSQAGLNFRPRRPEDLAAMHADAFFDKPIQPKQLLATVADLIQDPGNAR